MRYAAASLTYLFVNSPLPGRHVDIFNIETDPRRIRAFQPFCRDITGQFPTLSGSVFLHCTLFIMVSFR